MLTFERQGESRRRDGRVLGGAVSEGERMGREGGFRDAKAGGGGDLVWFDDDDNDDDDDYDVAAVLFIYAQDVEWRVRLNLRRLRHTPPARSTSYLTSYISPFLSCCRISSQLLQPFPQRTSRPPRLNENHMQR